MPSPSGQIVKAKSSMSPRWRRVVLKISGAALAGMTPNTNDANNIDPKVNLLSIYSHILKQNLFNPGRNKLGLKF